MISWKGFGRKWSWHTQGNIVAFAWRNMGNPVRIAGAAVKTSTKYFQNMSLKLF
jgi:hypothetical protein